MAAAPSTYDLPPVTVRVAPCTEAAARLAAAERLVAVGRHADAVVALEEVWTDVRGDQALALRQRLALAWAEMVEGNLDRADELLAHASGAASAPCFDAVDRAEVLFRGGALEFQRHNVADAVHLLTRALETNERAPRPRPLLAANAYEWRARCYVSRQDWSAAARDAEQALSHAEAASDEQAQARALFQASIIAERRREWLVARLNAEEALELFRRHGNTLAAARVLNNLGGIDFLLGDVASAEAHLHDAVAAADEAGSVADVAQAVNSLAQVYLRTGRIADAHARAARAVELLADRRDFLDELGNAQLVIARCHLAAGDTATALAWVDAAERSFDLLGSSSHRASTLVARGDVTRAAGDTETAADLYRRAAETLQDVHF
jgi:tetratricopeptide (TPR) repeat protein